MQKARGHSVPPASRRAKLPPLVSTRFQVLFHYPPGVLFTCPSPYSCTIGRQSVFSLRRWSSRIPTRFLVSRGTWEPDPGSQRPFAYGTFTLFGPSFQTVPLERWLLTSRRPCMTARPGPATPAAQRTQALTCGQV